MAKKTSKTDRGDQYAAIMAKDGYGPDEWRVLAFVFLSDMGPQYFHYELMMADPRPVYYLFDCFGETAQVIVPNDDPENERMCIQLAESCGGKKTTPNLR